MKPIQKICFRKMVNHKPLKYIQIKNYFEVTSLTFVNLIVMNILYYDNK